MAYRFLPFREVHSRTSISKAQTYRQINAGQFPRPVALGPRRVAILESEADAWMDERQRARVGAQK